MNSIWPCLKAFTALFLTAAMYSWCCDINRSYYNVHSKCGCLEGDRWQFIGLWYCFSLYPHIPKVSFQVRAQDTQIVLTDRHTCNDRGIVHTYLFNGTFVAQSCQYELTVKSVCSEIPSCLHRHIIGQKTWQSGRTRLPVCWAKTWKHAAGEKPERLTGF